MTPEHLAEIATQFNNAYNGNSWSIDLTGEDLVDIVDLALDGMELRAMQQRDEYDSDSYLEEVMNRDYFTKPMQHSRSSYDYGNSGPIEPMPTVGKSWNVAGVLIGGFVLALIVVAWVA